MIIIKIQKSIHKPATTQIKKKITFFAITIISSPIPIIRRERANNFAFDCTLVKEYFLTCPRKTILGNRR